MKHLTTSEDLTNEEFEQLAKRAEIFEKGLENGRDFTNLCRGKVIATEFFQESTRTSVSLQSAMIRLGGGWFGVSGTAGTYIAAGEEDIEDTLRAVAPFCDIMAVRHGDFSLIELAKKGFPVPLINGMCGGEEHTMATVGFYYSIRKRRPEIKGTKVGLYGSSGGSRAIKAIVKVLARQGVHFYEDSVVPEFKTPDRIKETFEQYGTTYQEGKLDDFIGEIDYLLVEGLPQAGTDQAVVDKFNEGFVSLSNEHLARMKKEAIISVIEPRIMTNGQYTSLKETDNDPRMLSKPMMKEFVYANMALITYLLGVDVKE